MTIQNRTLNDRLGHLETCADKAPEGMYVREKNLVATIQEAADTLRSNVRALGFVGCNNDHLRNLECAIYEYILASNPDDSGLLVAEGFGQHLNGPAGARVLAQAIRDRDAMEKIQANNPLWGVS